VEVELAKELFLDAARDSVTEEHAVRGTTTAARPGFGERRNFLMMSCRNSSAVSAVCLSSGKFERMPRSSSPPNGGFVRITSTRSLSPISRREGRGSFLYYARRRLTLVKATLNMGPGARPC
jgi:hypothetical protein